MINRNKAGGRSSSGEEGKGWRVKERKERKEGNLMYSL